MADEKIGTELKGAWKALLTFFVVACRRRNDTHFTGTKESFAGRITVLHGEETTKAEVMKIWKQTAGAHISDKERERKIQEESLITSDEHKRAVTRHGKPNTTAIIAVRPWSLLKALVKCFQENAETPLQQEGSPYTSREIKAYQQSEESNEEFDMHTKRERNVTGQDCRAKSRFCTNRKIGSNKITRPSDWYKLNEGIGGVRANYQSRLLHKRFNGGQQTI